MNSLTSLIILSIIVCIVSILYAVYESIAVLLMKDWAFRIGWVAVSLTEPFRFSPGRSVQREAGETGKCEYKFVSPKCCVFRERFHPLDILKKAGNPIKGRVTFENGMAEIQGRIPLGPLGVNAAIILGALGFGLKVVLEGGGAMAAGIFGAIILAAAWAYLIVLSNQKRRFMIAYEELKDHVARSQEAESA